MFELLIAIKYILPKKKNLSVALIGLMSVSVISLVVWLVLVFLSVTEGIERNWLKKLTDLNAPIKIIPTQKYFDSYYYKVDSISSSSGFQYKTIEEKALAQISDPYDPEEDREIPSHWPAKQLTDEGELLDPVKRLYTILHEIKGENLLSAFQDFEMSGALLKLQLLRSKAPLFSPRSEESIHFLTQATYISSLADQNPFLSDLLLTPTPKDIEHLFFLSDHQLSSVKSDGSPDIDNLVAPLSSTSIASLLRHMTIRKMKTSYPYWQIPHELLIGSQDFEAWIHADSKGIKYIVIPQADPSISKSSPMKKGRLATNGGKLYLQEDGSWLPIHSDTKILSHTELIFDVSPKDIKLNEDTPLRSKLRVQTCLQGKIIKGDIPWQGVEIIQCEPKVDYDKKSDSLPSWAVHIHEPTPHLHLPEISADEHPVILPKSFQENGVLLGDRGFLSFSAATISTTQEMRLGIFVAGFYDPGIMSVGNKCLLAPRQVTRAINASNTSLYYDKISNSGLQVWLKDLSLCSDVKSAIEEKIKHSGIEGYFSVISYKDYDFAKELLQQFQSDKYLFSLIAILIITVACCNIISLLVILVNDKKKEIGILLSMGSTTQSIAAIFGLCGVIMGTLGCILGCTAAYFTLKNIDTVVYFLSLIQGHSAFNPSFFGTSLPSTLSASATFFVLIATPLLATLAGLIPAIKACRLKPSSILRSQ